MRTPAMPADCHRARCCRLCNFRRLRDTGLCQSANLPGGPMECRNAVGRPRTVFSAATAIYRHRSQFPTTKTIFATSRTLARYLIALRLSRPSCRRISCRRRSSGDRPPRPEPCRASVAKKNGTSPNRQQGRTNTSGRFWHGRQMHSHGGGPRWNRWRSAGLTGCNSGECSHAIRPTA